MSQTPKRTADLSPDEKRALLERLLREKARQSKSFPLSFAQERLWSLNQLEQGNPFYNVAAALRLTGQLDARALHQALNEIINRHEILRTSFPTVDGLPVQIISAAKALTLSGLDISELPAGTRDAEAQRLVNEEALYRFDLAQGPLLRLSLLRLGEEEHLAVFTMHHIISDEWSTEILVREMAILYEAFLRGDSSPLPELPIQYADYAVWQRQSLQGELLREQLSYWKRQLKGAPPLLELPTDRPRPPIQTYSGSIDFIELSEDLSDRLKQLTRLEGMTLFMTMMAAFKVMLYRMTGQEDISVGTPVAGRTRGELEPLIGFFINTLVMRSKIKGELGFREIMRREKKVVLGAFAYQDVPFEKIVEEVSPERSLSYSPLFQVMFALKNEPREALQLANTKLEPVRTGLHIAKFDLNLTVLDSQELSLFMEYNTDLFDAATITRMLGNLHELLRGICANPEQPISRLPLLTQAETAYWSPLVGIQPGGSDQPFFCVHPGGGNVLCYVELARHLGPDQPFYAFQSRGLNSEQPVCTTIEEMASIYIEAMRTVRPVGPYLLGGWSMGGVVAFEMARQLEAQGEMVALLVLIDARAPSHQAELPEEDDLAAMRSFGQHVGLPLERINISLDHFLSLGSDERLAYVMEEAKSAGLIPAAIPLSQVRRLFEVFKANAMALSNYTPEMARCRIALLKASEPVNHLLEEPAMGWAELTENGIEVTEVPGNHFTMIREPYVLFMAERLKSCIHETLVSKLNNE